MSSYVVIEGLIGVGKTSLCRLMAARHKEVRLVLEPCEANPFLADFYADPVHFAFPAQMFYLASRYQQQQGLMQRELFKSMVFADYLFEKDRIFAEQTLNEDELSLYNRFTTILNDRIAVPNFIIFLDAPTKIIQQRIRKRNISSEQVIARSYLDALRDRYFRLWEKWDKCPIYVLDTTDINYIDSEADKQYMTELIDGWLSGTPLPGAPARYERCPVQKSLFSLF